jgi:hypothetical protein
MSETFPLIFMPKSPANLEALVERMPFSRIYFGFCFELFMVVKGLLRTPRDRLALLRHFYIEAGLLFPHLLDFASCVFTRASVLPQSNYIGMFDVTY